jgi:ribonuclease PH
VGNADVVNGPEEDSDSASVNERLAWLSIVIAEQGRAMPDAKLRTQAAQEEAGRAVEASRRIREAVERQRRER